MRRRLDRLVLAALSARVGGAFWAYAAEDAEGENAKNELERLYTTYGKEHVMVSRRSLWNELVTVEHGEQEVIVEHVIV